MTQPLRLCSGFSASGPETQRPPWRSCVLPGVLALRGGVGRDAAVVVESPHSGLLLPADFETTASASALRRMADGFVDRLYAGAPSQGASLLTALFTRCYLDLNRAADDIDPDLLADPWPSPLAPTANSRAGHGLIWRCLPDGAVLNRGPLSTAAILSRLHRYRRPYYRALGALLARHQRPHGVVCHFSVHSMPSFSAPRIGGHPADVALGDLDGAACAPALTAWIAQWFESRGLRVAVNRVYCGAELVRAHGCPDTGRHSLQIELRRDLYMDERTLSTHDGFPKLRQTLSALVAAAHRWGEALVGRRIAGSSSSILKSTRISKTKTLN